MNHAPGKVVAGGSDQILVESPDSNGGPVKRSITEFEMPQSDQNWRKNIEEAKFSSKDVFIDEEPAGTRNQITE